MAIITDPDTIMWKMAHAKHASSLADEWKAALINPYYIAFFQLIWSSYLLNL